MATKYNYNPDKIKRMLLEDPYRPLHNWNMLKHLKTLKEVTGIERLRKVACQFWK